MTDLPSLIERLEKAEGPDRELDQEIAKACGWQYVPASPFTRDGWISPDYQDYDEAPYYTASLDAHLPGDESAWWQIHGPSVEFGIWNVRRVIGKSPDILIVEAIGHTEPIARRIAALKARQANEEAA